MTEPLPYQLLSRTGNPHKKGATCTDHADAIVRIIGGEEHRYGDTPFGQAENQATAYTRAIF
jgi:hypothetical protein